MQSQISKWQVQVFVFAVQVTGLVLLYVGRAGEGYPLDDSWIHQVYGRNLADYGEWAFIPDEPSAASTAPLYTVLLATGYALNISHFVWTHLLGGVALILTGVLGANMARRISNEQVWTPLFVGLAMIGAWHLIWASVSGMETMLFSMFTLLLMWLAWRELDERSVQQTHIILRGAMFGFVTSLAVLTRPEGAMLAGIIGLIMLIVRPQGNWRNVIVWGVGAMLGFIVLMIPYVIQNLELTDGILPATSDAKYAQHLVIIQEKTYFQRLLIMTVPIIAGGQLLLLPGIVQYVSRRVRDLRSKPQNLLLLIPLFWSVGLIALYAARLPAGYQHGRYMIPILPSLIVMGVVGVSHLILATNDDERDFSLGRLLSRGVGLSAIGAFAYFGTILGSEVYATDVAIINEEMVTVAQWIDENIPPDELLAVHDIGAVGYFASRPIVDIAGLLNPDVIPFIDDEEPLWAYMEEQGARYLMAFTDQIPGDEVDDHRICPIYQSDGRTAINAGGSKMVVYVLTWTGECPT